MGEVELCTVSDTFQIAGQGLLIMPDFDVPDAGWTSRSTKATIITPQGMTFQAEMRLGVTHLNIRDPNASIQQRWRIIPTFFDLSKEQLPIGSRVYVHQTVAESLFGCIT